jgi:hypothetical protein
LQKLAGAFKRENDDDCVIVIAEEAENILILRGVAFNPKEMKR